MRFTKGISLSSVSALAMLGLSACDSTASISTIMPDSLNAPGSNAPGSISNPPPAIAGSPSNNEMQITVNGSLCAAATTADIGYSDKPCASVTICKPGTATCQTISDILVDTGSYGLRVFPSGTNADGSSYNLAPLSLPAVQQGGQNVADCAQFLDGSALWGEVVRADVILASGGETASSVPIQLIDANYAGSVPTDCDGGQAASSAAGTSGAGFNGILGVGLWAQDCGVDCDPAYVQNVGASGISTDFYPYYTCSGNTCTQALISIANQVANPVTAFPVNNNGLIFELPAISPAGVVSANGVVVFGIGTGGNSNNTLPATATTYLADYAPDFTTVYNGVTYDDSAGGSVTGSFIDSGSNSLYFTPPSTMVCCQADSNGNPTSTTVACTDSSSSGYMCPATTYTGSATNQSSNYSTGAPQGTGVPVSFSIENFFTLGSGTAMVFSDVGTADENCSANAPCTFDFGLPFFFGRNIYVGFQQIQGLTLTVQPYWAY